MTLASERRGRREGEAELDVEDNLKWPAASVVKVSFFLVCVFGSTGKLVLFSFY
jgi:hypothetical protein